MKGVCGFVSEYKRCGSVKQRPDGQLLLATRTKRLLPGAKGLGKLTIGSGFRFMDWGRLGHEWSEGKRDSKTAFKGERRHANGKSKCKSQSGEKKERTC